VSTTIRPPVGLPQTSIAMRGPLLTDPTGAGLPMLPGMGLPGMVPGNPFDPLGYLRPPMPAMPPGFPPGLAGLQRPPLPDMMAAQAMNRSTAPHVNPAFLFKQQWEGASNSMASSSPSHLGLGTGLEEDELSDVMHRNQQVSTTAIQRAQDEASSGDTEGAIDTLRMAINIIKQSSVAKMDSTQVLIKSLQDCMTSIEGQSSTRHSSGRRHDDKDRSSRHRDRSHDRDYRSSRHRDRSRERRRY
jgi:cleavage and polyadenylation specificity factor subunit 6/7